MRIVTKIASAGASGLSRFPCLKASIDECRAPSGRLDEGKARRALLSDQVQISSKDDIRSIAFALEYLTQLESVTLRLMDKLNQQGEVQASVSGVEGSARPEAAETGISRCERNMNKGRFAFVRTDISACSDGIHVKLSIQNPRGVVGNAESHARQHALICARILIYLRSVISTSPIILLEGDGAHNLFADAALQNSWDDLSQKRAACKCLHNNYCSPVSPSCPLFFQGKCLTPEQLPPTSLLQN